MLRCGKNQIERFRRKELPLLKEHLGHYCHTVVADLYEGLAGGFKAYHRGHRHDRRRL